MLLQLVLAEVDAFRTSQPGDWARAKRPFFVMLGLWMVYFLLVNWFVHSLNKIAIPVLDIPLGFYLVAQGAVVVFAVALFRFARAAE